MEFWLSHQPVMSPTRPINLLFAVTCFHFHLLAQPQSLNFLPQLTTWVTDVVNLSEGLDLLFVCWNLTQKCVGMAAFIPNACPQESQPCSQLKWLRWTIAVRKHTVLWVVGVELNPVLPSFCIPSFPSCRQLLASAKSQFHSYGNLHFHGQFPRPLVLNDGEDGPKATWRTQHTHKQQKYSLHLSFLFLLFGNFIFVRLFRILPLLLVLIAFCWTETTHHMTEKERGKSITQ